MFVAIAVVILLGLFSAGCDVYRNRLVIVDENMQPGWVVIEYGNKRCSPAGVFSETIRVSREGFACSSSNLPVVFDWRCKRRKGNGLEELQPDRDYTNGITTVSPGRRFLLFRYTPDGRPVPDNPEDAVGRYLEARSEIRER